MGEKRKNKRSINRTPVKFGKNGCDKTAFTSNLSREGFFVRTNRAFNPGTILLFEFQDSRGQKIMVKGRVMHASRFPVQFASLRKSGMGIEIVEENEAYVTYIESAKK